MFRRILIITLLLVTVAASYAVADPLGFLRNGEYVYYHDTRSQTAFYRGYCVFRTKDGSIVFFIRNLNLSNGQESNVEGALKVDKNGEPSITNMRLPEQGRTAEGLRLVEQALQVLAAERELVGVDMLHPAALG